MKILVTGCQGFIGNNLVKHLIKQKHYVVGIDISENGRKVLCDLTMHNMETPLTIENDFDRVYHLSADVANATDRFALGFSLLLPSPFRVVFPCPGTEPARTAGRPGGSGN